MARPRRRHRHHALAQSARQTAASSTTRRTADRRIPTVTDWIEARANELLEAEPGGVQRMPYARRCAPPTTHRHDYLGAYVADLGAVIDMDAIRGAGVRIGVDPLGGAGVALLAAHRRTLPAEPRRSSATTVDATFRFMTARLGRQDPHGPVLAYAMAGLIGAQGPLRRRLRLRHRPRPARHRRAQRRPAAAQPLSGGRRSTICSAPPRLEARRRRSARPWSAAR